MRQALVSLRCTGARSRAAPRGLPGAGQTPEDGTEEGCLTIGTAYLRLDLLPLAAQPALRQSFHQYGDTRLEVYRKLPDIQAVQAELAKATALQMISGLRRSPLAMRRRGRRRRCYSCRC